jgi:hypothetical protein
MHNKVYLVKFIFLIVQMYILRLTETQISYPRHRRCIKLVYFLKRHAHSRISQQNYIIHQSMGRVPLNTLQLILIKKRIRGIQCYSYVSE